jgi:putative tricarboxylic transport membrane protein
LIKLSDLHLGVLTALLSAVLLFYSWNFAAIPGQAYGAGTLPRLLGYAGILLGCIMIVQGLVGGREQWRAHLADWVRSPRSVAGVLAIIGVIVFYIFFSPVLGFLPTAVIVMLVPMLILRVNPLIAIAVAIVMAFFVRYAFGQLLLVPLPRSPFLPFLG